MNLSHCGLLLNVLYALSLTSNTSNPLVIRDLRTLETIVNTKESGKAIDVNALLSEFKQVTHLKISHNDLYNYFMFHGVKFHV